MKKGKKYLAKKEQVERGKLYEVEEAVELVKKLATANFDETVELHLKLGVDSRHADQQVRGAIVLPNGTGKTVRVLAFAKGPKADEAKEAGAEYVGAEEYTQKIQQGWLDFDAVLSTPDMMGVVGRLGRILGPRGLMPNPNQEQLHLTLQMQSRKSKPVRLNTDLTSQTSSTLQLERQALKQTSSLKTSWF